MRTCCINWEIIKARLTPSFGAKGHHHGPEPALGLPKSSPNYCSSSLPKLEPLSVIGHSLLITLLVICGLRIHFHSANICFGQFSQRHLWQISRFFVSKLRSSTWQPVFWPIVVVAEKMFSLFSGSIINPRFDDHWVIEPQNDFLWLERNPALT